MASAVFSDAFTAMVGALQAAGTLPSYAAVAALPAALSNTECFVAVATPDGASRWGLVQVGTFIGTRSGAPCLYRQLRLEVPLDGLEFMALRGRLLIANARADFAAVLAFAQQWFPADANPVVLPTNDGLTVCHVLPDGSCVQFEVELACASAQRTAYDAGVPNMPLRV